MTLSLQSCPARRFHLLTEAIEKSRSTIIITTLVVLALLLLLLAMPRAAAQNAVIGTLNSVSLQLNVHWIVGLSGDLSTRKFF